MTTKKIKDVNYNESGLLECPFCGEFEDVVAKKKYVHGTPLSINGQSYWRIECLPCDARTGNCFDGDAPDLGYSNGKEMAKDLWNRRAIFEKEKIIETVIPEELATVKNSHFTKVITLSFDTALTKEVHEFLDKTYKAGKWEIKSGGTVITHEDTTDRDPSIFQMVIEVRV